MITGFNTDVEYDGVIYHVQTEDKGLESPLILSLVYSGGAILASKRSPYDDLIAAGFDEQTLTERLQRQHKLICAAINAGRLDDLKKMSGRPGGMSATPPPPPDVPPASQEATPTVPPRPITIPAADTQSAPTPLRLSKLEAVPASPSPPMASTLPGKIPDAPIRIEPAPAEPPRQSLHLGLLEERELRGGEFVTLRVRLSRGTSEARDAVPDAVITLKILGTTFRPVISSARTDQDGIAIVFAALPRFATGRAAILIKANTNGESVEMRRIVHPC